LLTELNHWCDLFHFFMTLCLRMWLIFLSALMPERVYPLFFYLVKIWSIYTCMGNPRQLIINHDHSVEIILIHTFHLIVNVNCMLTLDTTVHHYWCDQLLNKFVYLTHVQCRVKVLYYSIMPIYSKCINLAFKSIGL
jgi:hypothetical protein